MSIGFALYIAMAVDIVLFIYVVHYIREIKRFKNHNDQKFEYIKTYVGHYNDYDMLKIKDDIVTLQEETKESYETIETLLNNNSENIDHIYGEIQDIHDCMEKDIATVGFESDFDFELNKPKKNFH